MSPEMQVSSDTYKQWITSVSQRYRASQIRAAVKVNEEMLRFYYVLGGEMEQIKPAFKFGDKFYQTLSADLQTLLPEIKSFSPKNLRYIHKYYQLFSSFSNYPQLVAKLDSASENGKFELNFDEICEKAPKCIFQIPWGHSRYIIDRCSGNPEHWSDKQEVHQTGTTTTVIVQESDAQML